MLKAIVFTTLVLLYIYGIDAKTCTEHLKELEGKPKLLGEFRPVCQSNGDYAETQCHENYCFCVMPETGEELKGTRIRNGRPVSCKATPCLLQRHNVLKSRLIGAFQPQCEADGSFKKTQCHGSTGYCFCVFPKTGKKVLGTEVRFNRPQSCELTECVKQRHKALSAPSNVHIFVPKCAPDGSYEQIQCQEGFCFCVFKESGKEVMGTRLTVRGAKPTSCQLTPCVIQRHNVLNAKIPLLGAFRPQCNEDGSYKPIQCHEGFCYCVFPSGEEILGTRGEKRGDVPVSCKITPCVLARHKGWAQAKWGLLGVPITRCDPYGKYDKVQCRKGMCWCVDPDTGKPIAGTAKWTIPDC